MVLDGDGACRIHAVLDISGGHPVDLDLDFRAFAGDAVFVPVIAFEAVAGTLAEGLLVRLGGGFLLRCDLVSGWLDRADEPHAASFVIETT